jgi:hypothetical protein
MSCLTDWVRERGAGCVAQNSLPHQYFSMFRTKVFAAFDLLFSEEKTSSPLRKRGKLEPIHFTCTRRISVVSTLLAYETLCDVV